MMEALMHCLYCKDTRLDPLCESEAQEDRCDPRHSCPVCVLRPLPHCEMCQHTLDLVHAAVAS